MQLAGGPADEALSHFVDGAEQAMSEVLVQTQENHLNWQYVPPREAYQA